MEVTMTFLSDPTELSFDELQFEEPEQPTESEEAPEEAKKVDGKAEPEPKDNQKESEGNEKDAKPNDKEAEEKDEKNTKKELGRSARRRANYRNRIAELDKELSEARAESLRLKKQYGLADEQGFPMQPNPNNYRDEASYVKDYKLWQNEVSKIRATQEAETEIAFRDKVEGFQKALNEGGSHFSDYREVISNSSVHLNDNVLNVLIDPQIISNPADMAYYLAKYPTVLSKMNNMGERQLLAEMSKASQQLKQHVTKKLTRPVKEPPKTLKKVGGGGAIPEVDPLSSDAAFDAAFFKGS